MKVFTIAHVPEELVQAWLQHLRDFDTSHPDCHFEVAMDCPDMTIAQMVQKLQIEPELSFQDIFLRDQPK